ncbi:unnamed protein product [Agarophyton chilense]
MSDDERALRHVTALNDLVANYPDISLQIVHDVLQACQYDHKRAYDTICEMIIPPEATQQHSSNKSTPQHSQVTYAPSPQSTPSVLSQQRSVLSSSAPSRRFSPPNAPRNVRPPHPQGVWANNNMGRRYQVDSLCEKYQWMSRAHIQRLLNTYQGCIEVVEEEILHMFPVDEPQAFGGGQGIPPAQQSPLPLLPTHQQAIAKSLRDKDAAEIRNNTSSAASASCAAALVHLRHQLWEERTLLVKANVLACQTRKPVHHKRAKDIENNVKTLSAHFLDRLRQSEDYKNGLIDLHGLTKEEAIQLVEWKLLDSGRRRFRVITGKGIHSHNEQAVLRPALEKHFRTKGISFTRYEDGILSVIPR